MRLGLYPGRLEDGSKVRDAYGTEIAYERHRHRFEVNNAYRERLASAGMWFSGVSPDGRLVEYIELRDHPWFVATQAHPELKSRPNRPHPLFRDFVGAASSRAAAPARAAQRLRSREDRCCGGALGVSAHDHRAAAGRRPAFDRSPLRGVTWRRSSAEREEELYQHGLAGLRDELALGPIYERHAALFSRKVIDALRRQLERGARRRARSGAAVGSPPRLIDRAVSTSPMRSATAEATAAVMWRGERIPYRALRNAHRRDQRPRRAQRAETQLPRCRRGDQPAAAGAALGGSAHDARARLRRPGGHGQPRSTASTRTRSPAICRRSSMPPRRPTSPPCAATSRRSTSRQGMDRSRISGIYARQRLGRLVRGAPPPADRDRDARPAAARPGRAAERDARPRAAAEQVAARLLRARPRAAGRAARGPAARRTSTTTRRCCTRLGHVEHFAHADADLPAADRARR